MFSFIRRHWFQYLIGVALAIALGLGAAYLVWIKGSTPRTDQHDSAKTLTGGGASTSSDATDPSASALGS